VQAILGFFGQAGGKPQGRVQDFVVHALHVAVVERGQAANHFVHQSAKTPPVHRLHVEKIIN